LVNRKYSPTGTEVDSARKIGRFHFFLGEKKKNAPARYTIPVTINPIQGIRNA